MKLTFNQLLIESLGGEEEKYDLYDAAQKGLFVRVRKSGTKLYCLKHKGKVIPLGNAEEIPLEAIRDTVLSKYNVRNTSKQTTLAVTIGKFYRTEMRGLIESLAISTCKDYTRYMEQFILPVFEKRSLSSITVLEIRKFHNSMQNTKYQANRVLATLSRLYSYAYELGYTNGNNPCRAIKKFKEKERTRYLHKDELIRLKDYLYSHRRTDRELIHSLVLEFLLLTGCRVSEALSLTKENATGKSLIWPETKTGLKRLPMTDRLRSIIAKANSKNNTDKVFAEYKVCSKSSVSKYWSRIRQELFLEDVRLHDFRHTFGSYANKGGFTMEHIRDLLNHKNISSTIRYIHVSEEDQRVAMNDMAKRMGF